MAKAHVLGNEEPLAVGPAVPELPGRSDERLAIHLRSPARLAKPTIPHIRPHPALGATNPSLPQSVRHTGLTEGILSHLIVVRGVQPALPPECRSSRP
jgi:hypothetical protein